MAIRFEANPPRVIEDSKVSKDLLRHSFLKFEEKIKEISKYVDYIHITDSVLGIPRISPISVGAKVRSTNNSINMTTSLRVRDRNLTSITQFVSDATLLDFKGVLILKGDSPPVGPTDSGIVPSDMIKYLNDVGFGKNIELYLSISNKPDFTKIQKKIDAEPFGFMTQVIHTKDEVIKLVDNLKPQGFKVIPIVLFPSEKNRKAADFLKLDWSGYGEDFKEFIKDVQKLAGEVLITSPGDYSGVKKFFETL